jgi:phage/plasmid-like protein (TIGR03299 family)
MVTKSKTSVNGLHDWQKVYKNSNLNWEVEKKPLFDENNKKLPIFGTFRKDTSQFLGAVTGQYNIIQNDNIFQAAQSLQKEGLDLQYKDSNYFNGGKSVFASFNLPQHRLDIINVGDIVETKLIIRALHDGSGSFTFKLCALRLVCTNGMTALKEQALFSVRHTATYNNRLGKSKDVVGIATTGINEFNQLMNCFAKTKLNVSQVGEIVKNTFANEEGDLSNIAINKASLILEKFENNDNDTFKKQRNTAYALLNAFTNYTDHSQNYRVIGEETEAQAKLKGVLFGTGESLKMSALLNIATLIKNDMPQVKLPKTSLLEGVL